MNELLHIPYSPWSEKARWALQCRSVPHKARVYVPLFGEPELRWRLKRPFQLISAPVMFTAEGACTDSLAIARYAARHGDGPELFPAAAEEAIARWDALSEKGLAAGRCRSLMRMRKSPTALRELVPKQLRGLGSVAVRLADLGVARTLRKYGARSPLVHLAEQRDVLDALLQRSSSDGWSHEDPPTLIPEHGFTYADISMSQVLAFIQPPTSGLRIGRSSRQTFFDDALQDQAAELLVWRDALYAKYRGLPART